MVRNCSSLTPNLTPQRLAGSTGGADQQSIFNAGALHTFDARWKDGTFPTQAAGCTPASACQVHGDTCICTITVDNSEAVFTDSSNMPSRDQVEHDCLIGAPNPTLYDAGTYAKCTTSACSSQAGVSAWLRSGSGGVFNVDTIFEIKSFRGYGPTQFLMNRKSLVKIGSGSETYQFRNPPHFMAFERPVETPAFKEAAVFESDALLQYLHYHPNVAPFTAKHLIMRLIKSNPSPRYVKVFPRSPCRYPRKIDPPS